MMNAISYYNRGFTLTNTMYYNDINYFGPAISNDKTLTEFVDHNGIRQSDLKGEENYDDNEFLKTNVFRDGPRSEN
eukprot:Pgem_evm1s1800